MAALRLCGFDAFQGARVYPNPRAMKKVTGVKSLARSPAAQLKINLGMGVLVRNNKGTHNGEDTTGEQCPTWGTQRGMTRGEQQRGMTRDGN